MGIRQPVRKGVILFSSAVAILYLLYRTFFTLNLTTGYAVFASVVLLIGETYGVMTMLLYFLQVWDTTEPPEQPVLEGRTVDVFVPTYNEDPDILRVTLRACVAMDYPHRTFLCDDGGTDARVNDPEKGPGARKRQEQLKAMCEEIGAIYVTRPKNEHAKAGNLNHAFEKTDGEFILIFDADHVPDKNFITRLIGYFADEKLAFVQTPHAFYNFESFQARLDHERGSYWEEGQLFYHVIQPGRNRWNAAIFAGSAAMFRRTALAEVGYIAVETITEDMHTGLRMHMRGWKSLGIGERMISGAAAQDVTTFHSQRLRWGEGNLSVLAYDNPLTVPGLKWGQRLCYFATMINWAGGLFKLPIYLTPILMLLTGVPPVKEFTWTLAAIMGTYMAVAILGVKYVSNGYGSVWYSELFTMASFWTQIRGTMRALFWRKFQQFVVTQKRGRQSKSTWPYLRPHVYLIALSVVALAWAWGRLWLGVSDDYFKPILATFWTLFHALLAYLVVRRALWPDDRRFATRHLVHLPIAYECPDAPGGPRGGLGVTVDLNEPGVGFVAYERLPMGGTLRLSIQAVGEDVSVEGTIKVVRELVPTDGRGLTAYRYGVAFQNQTPAQSDAINRLCLHYAVPRLYGYYGHGHEDLEKAVRSRVAAWLRGRRFAERHEYHLPLYLRPEGEPAAFPAATEDVSRHALSVVLHRPFAPQAVIHFVMPTPLGEVIGQAHVLRCEPRAYAGHTRYYCVLELTHFEDQGRLTLQTLLGLGGRARYRPALKPARQPMPVPLNKPLAKALALAVPLLLVEYGAFRWVYRDDLFLRDVATSTQLVSAEDAERVERLYKETMAVAYPGTDRLVLLGNALQRLDRPNELAEVTKLLARRDARNSDLQVALAFAYDLRDEHELAEQTFQRLLADVDSGRLPARRREELLLGAARSGVHANQLQLARTRFEELMRLRPEKIEYRNELAGVLLGGQRYDDVLRLYAAVEPDYDGRLLLVMTHTAARDYEAAAREAQAILKVRPNDPTAEGLLADVLSLQGNRLQARAIYERLLKSDAANLKIAVQLAHLSLWAKNYAEALERFQAIFDQNGDKPDLLQKYPEVARAYVNAAAGAPQVGKGQLAVARQLAERALSTGENDAAYLARLGWVLHRLGEFDRSSSLLERAYSLNPADQAIRRQFAGVLVAMGKADEALKLLEGRESNFDARLLLVDVYVMNKDLDAAVRECRSLRSEQPDSRTVLEKLANVLSWKKDYAESLEIFGRLARDDPDNATYPVRLAEVTLWSGDCAGALRRYEALLAADFDRPVLWWGFVDAAAGAASMTDAQVGIAQALSDRARSGEHKTARVLQAFAREGKELSEDVFLTRLAWVLLHHVKDPVRANEILDLAVALRPREPARRRELAGVLAAAGRSTDALRQYEGLTLEWRDHLALARIHAAAEQFDAAARECRLALEKQPLDREAQRLLADVQSWSGYYGLALADYERLLRRFPDDAELRRRVAEVTLWNGDAPKARALFEAMLVKNFDQPPLWIGFLEAAGRVDRLTPEQTQFLKRVVAQPISPEPRHVEWMVHVARVQQRHLGQADEARALLRKAMSLKSRDAAALTRLGWALSQLGERPDAEAVLRQAVALRPRKPSVCLELAGVLVAVQHFKEARALLEDRARAEPANGELQARLAQVTLWAGDAPLALSRLEKTLRGKFEQPSVWVTYVDAASGVARGILTRPQVELLLRVAAQPIPEAAPDKAAYLSRLAWSLYREDEKDRAGELLDRAVALQPKDAATRKELAGVLVAAGRAKQALPWLEEMARANPDDAALQVRLAQASLWGGEPLAATGRLEKLLAAKFEQPALWATYVDAVAALGKGAMTRPQVDLLLRVAAQPVPEAAPDKAAYLSRLAWSLYREGQKDRAAEFIDKVIALKPRDLKTRRELAGVLSAAGRFKEARGWLEEAARDNPGDAALQGQYAQVILWSGDAAGGLALLHKALEARIDQPELWPSYVDAASTMTRGTLTREQVQMVLKLAERPAPDSVPDRALYLSRLGWVLQREGEKTAAGRVIDQAIAAKPTDPKTRRELAGVLTAMGRNEAGLALYEGLTLSLDDRFQLVVLHSAARQFAEARKQCEAILREKADDARARRWLADVTLWAAQYADALEQYHKLLTPDFEGQPELWPKYAEAASRVDHLTESQLRLALRILDRSENTPDTLFLARLALVLHRAVEEPAALTRVGAGTLGLLASPFGPAPALAVPVLVEGARTSRSRTLLARAVESRPQDATTLARLSWVTYRMGDGPLAARLLDEAMALKPVEPIVRREVGDALVATGRLDAALEWFEELARTYPKDVELQMRLAEVTVWSGAYEKGLERVAALLEDDFRRTSLWHTYVDAAAGVSSLGEGQIALALRLVEQPLPIKGDAAQTVYLSRLAWALHREGERLHRTTWQARVIELLDRAIKLGSRDPAARRELAGMLVAARRFKDALPFYEELVRQFPADAELRLRLAEVTLYTGAYAQALARFEVLLREDGSQARAWRGFVDAAAGVPELTGAQARLASRFASREARPRFDRAADEAVYLSRLGWVLVREGKRTKSREWAEQAGELLDRAVAVGTGLGRPETPDDLEARLQLADVLSWAGKYTETVKLCEAILAVKPEERRAQVKLAEVALWSGEYDTALGRYHRLLEKDWRQPELWAGYLDAASAAKSFDAKAHRALVLRILEKTDVAASRDAESLSRFAWVLRRVGEPARGVRLLRRALELEPTSRPIRRRLAEALTDAKEYAEAEKHFRVLLQSSEGGRPVGRR